MSFSLPLKSQQSRSTEVLLHSLSLCLCLSLDFLNPAMASDRNHNNLPNVPASPKRPRFLSGFAASMKEIIEQEKLKKSRTTKTTANNTRIPIETTAQLNMSIPMTLGTSQPLVTNDKNVSIPTSLVPAPAAQADQSATLLSMSSMHQQQNPKFGTSTPWSRLLSKHPLTCEGNLDFPRLHFLECGRREHTSAKRCERRRYHLFACFQYWFKSIRPSHYRRPRNEYDPLQDCPTTVSPSVGIAEAQRRSLDPLAECDKTKYYLLASFVLHIKHSESKDSAVSPRILLSGPAGSEIYQEKSSKALAHHFRAKLLVFHSRLYLSGSFTTGPKQILEGIVPSVGKGDMLHSSNAALRVPVSQKTKNRCFKSVGPNFGSQGKIVLTSENSSSFKVGVRFDKPIPEGQDLGGLCEAGHGFFCNASELQPESTTLKDLQKSINNILLEFLLENSEAHQNSKEKECYCGKQEKEKFLVTTDLLSELFPNKITIDMPKDEKHKAVLKRQFANDLEFLKSRGKLYVLIRNVPDCDELGTLSIVDQTLTIESAAKVIKWALGYQLMECPQNNANSSMFCLQKAVNSIPYCNSGSIQYGLDALRETQTDLNSSEKSLKDVVKENEFEKRLLADVIPPNEIGVKFDDVGVLENVKDTLRELVMLPLQRPELFSKGQLRKLSEGILLFGPPGTGKTMLAKAVAIEAGANFINSSMSSIASKWYGDPEKYVRAVFSLASKIAPSVIFIDEVDSMLRQRRNQEHKATRKMKNEFMVNWDGLRTKDKERVLVLAATNRPFDLDEAVIRRMPRWEELSPDVDFDAIAGMTDGFSRKSLCHCCIRSVREILEKERKKKAVMNESSDVRPINMNDFKYAREQVSASVLTESMNMNGLLQWNELYGEGGSQKKTSTSYYI
ncbi:unnamed protein product [Camellia sinensis]